VVRRFFYFSYPRSPQGAVVQGLSGMKNWLNFAGALAVLALGLAPATGAAHALLHEVIDADALVLKLSFPGGDAPLFEAYEIYAPGNETPFQAGRVNAIGEVSFRPDRPGEWQVKVFTADGHGTVVRVAVDAAGSAASITASQDAHAHGYAGRVLAGLGYLLGLFGIWALWRGRRAATG
jgi:nickel transport protein